LSAFLAGGVYPPLPTFFMTQDELDLVTLRQHLLRLADTGIAGYVLMGSNGEAVHLMPKERARVIATAREVVNGTNAHLSIIAGCGDQSVPMTLAHCRTAAEAGADYALVLPPFYYRSRMLPSALHTYYQTIADESPLPVILYNMPANTAGLDLDAALIARLAEHPNIVGVKDSAGNIAKLAQIVAAVPDDFRVFAGSAGYFLPALAVGACGVVAALANIYPQEVCRLQGLFQDGQLEEARQLQARMVPVNAAVTTMYGVPGLKAALELTVGYGGEPRLPLLPLTEQERQNVAAILKEAALKA
jgi:4-hydroxy-2-oxoglutarate aldolase